MTEGLKVDLTADIKGFLPITAGDPEQFVRLLRIEPREVAGVVEWDVDFDTPVDLVSRMSVATVEQLAHLAEGDTLVAWSQGARKRELEHILGRLKQVYPVIPVADDEVELFIPSSWEAEVRIVTSVHDLVAVFEGVPGVVDVVEYERLGGVMVLDASEPPGVIRHTDLTLGWEPTGATGLDLVLTERLRFVNFDRRR
ncbi:MAG: hypothetical protein WCC60_04590 [Ilumatobacteraceae bacterium]